MIAVVGNSGIGKTTLARLVAERLGLPLALEQHAERPFQALCAHDPRRYALVNQVDYLVFRAEQESQLHRQSSWGVLDGGLDLDYHGFTLLFHRRGYLDAAEAAVCGRLYRALRSLYPPPRVYVRLVAPISTVLARYDHRQRPLEVTQRQDLEMLEALLQQWLSGLQGTPVLPVDASTDDASYARVLDELLPKLRLILAAEPEC
jgi:deoxyadenosine/deoxycytidine kinase